MPNIGHGNLDVLGRTTTAATAMSLPSNAPQHACQAHDVATSVTYAVCGI